MAADQDTWRHLTDADLRQIDDWCDDFEARWRGGSCLSIEALVAAAPEALRLSLRHELECLQMELSRTPGAEFSPRLRMSNDHPAQ